MDKKSKLKWRVNYVVSYEKPNYALHYRELCLQTLKNVAQLYKIDCATKVDYPFYDDEFFEKYKDLRGLSSDLVYFRASPQTTIFARDFRRLIDAIFQDYSSIDLNHVEVGSQDYNSLKKYLFPKETENFVSMSLN